MNSQLQKLIALIITMVFFIVVFYLNIDDSSNKFHYKINSQTINSAINVEETPIRQTTNQTTYIRVTNCSVRTVRKNQTIQLDVDGDLKCLLGAYTKQLTSYRLSIVNSNTSITNNEPQHTVIGNDNCRECDYFGLIGKFNYAITIRVSWKSLVDSNWTKADYPIKHHYEDLFPPGQVCTSSNEAAECLYHITSQSHLVKSYNLPLPIIPKKADQGFPKIALFSHVLLNGQIDERGNVRAGKLDLIVNQCAVKRFVYKPTKKYVDEILIVHQFWGDTYFHAHVESMLRIAPYIQFLRDNPKVHIYVGALSLRDNLGLFGIAPGRLVKGDLRARIIYVPQGSGCGSAQPLQAQIIHNLYKKSILDHLNPGPWNSVVQICRSNRRFLIQEKQVAAMLEKYSKIYNFTYEQFRDNPTPSFNETLRMFSRARIVVAPHGAGLANMLYARSETRLVEVLQSKHVNAVFRHLARYLAQPYVGLISIKPNEDVNLGVDVPYLDKIMKSMMEAIRTN